jgi:ABC-type lipoprotein release transport system permease subunit
MSASVERHWAFKCSTNGMILKSFGLMILLVSLSVVNGLAQTAKDDIKGAGQDIKQAGKSTGSAAKKTAKATKKTVKKGVNKTAEKTAEGADRVEQKTR